jgi:hypothetical protein
MPVETLVGKAEHELWLLAHEYPRQLPRRLPLVHACQVAVWEIEALRSRSAERARCLKQFCFADVAQRRPGEPG